MNKVEQASDKIFKTPRGLGSQLLSTGWLLSVHPACQILLVLLVSLLFGRLLLVSGGSQSPGSENALMMACWFLVLAGIAGTLLIGNGISWGWLIMFGLQPLWVAYAIATEQHGLIPGALAYGAVQLHGFIRSRASSPPRPSNETAE